MNTKHDKANCSISDCTNTLIKGTERERERGGGRGRGRKRERERETETDRQRETEIVRETERQWQTERQRQRNIPEWFTDYWTSMYTQISLFFSVHMNCKLICQKCSLLQCLHQIIIIKQCMLGLQWTHITSIMYQDTCEPICFKSVSNLVWRLTRLNSVWFLFEWPWCSLSFTGLQAN